MSLALKERELDLPQPALVVSLARDTPELAAAYDHVGVRQFEHGKTLIDSLALRPGEQVLDVGCGTGLLSAWVAARLGPGGSVVGIDPLPLRVELAARKHPRFTPRVGRAEDLSAFADGQFDVVYLNSVLHWVADQPRALAEAFRVLKPGGRIGLNSADAQRTHQSQLLVQQSVEEEGLGRRVLGAGGAHHRVSADELRSLLEQAGFTRRQTREHTFVDEVRDADDVIAWSRASSFGNFLADFDHSQLQRVRDRLARKLDALRTAKGILLERYLVFATAFKPAPGNTHD